MAAQARKRVTLMKCYWIVLACLVIFVTGGSSASELPLQSLLKRLDPDRPEMYLDIAEELALIDSPTEDSLITDLLVRAVYHCNRTGSVELASAACIALADLNLSIDQDWLWDLALLLDPARHAEWTTRSRIDSDQDPDGLDRLASMCLYSVRYNQYPESAELFRRHDIRARIIDAAVQVGIDEGEVVAVIQKEIERGADDPCRGRLYVIDRETGERTVCPNHVRALGFCANDEDLRTLLRVEMVLLGVEVDTWNAAASMQQDQPIEWPTINELMKRLQVDPSKAYYRDGVWQSQP